ncbi:MAG: winged helix-turn-helix domain-containing protein [Anaerolineae bacterium]|nr:winged helix-turn-helix domain-containing protein [Anaerolineae bacterium]
MLPQHIAETERETLQLRLLALLVVVAGLFLLREEIQLLPAVLLALAYLAYSISLRMWIIPKFPGPGVVYAMILVDAVALTIGSYLVGGVTTIFIVLFPLSVVHYAIYLGYGGSFVAATVMALCLVGLAVVEGRLLSSGAALAGQVILYYLLASLSGYLGQERIRESQEKQAVQELLDVEAGAKAVLDVALRVYDILNLGDVLEEVTREVPGIIGLPCCIIALFDQISGQLTGRTSTVSLEELGVGQIEHFTEASDSLALAGQALEARKPLLVATTDLASSAWPEWATRLGLEDLLVVPLIFRDRDVGVMYLGGNDGCSATEVDMRLAEAIGGVAGVAIGNALIYREAQNRIEQLVEELETAIRSIGDLRHAKFQRALEIDDLLIDPVQRQVVVAGEPVNLSATEFDVLYLLAVNAGKVVGYDYLSRMVWGGGGSHSKNVVNVCIHRLRKKIEDDPSTATRIRAVRGVGYMLCSESENRRS